MYLKTNVVLLCFVAITLDCAFTVHIENNAYKGVTIGFSPSIHENEINSTKLQNVIQKSSELLYRATRRRAFFSEVVLLYPTSWSRRCDQSTAAGVLQPQEISIYVTNSNNEDDETSLFAQHSKGCGEQGEVIYMPSSWLNGNEEELSREFVQQWAIYRYGVFEEKRDPGDWPCFTSDGEHWTQSGCYSIDINVDLVLDSNGLPACDTKEISDYYDVKSSLMSTDHSSNITDFCDGSKLLPHNPLAPTRHNRICRGKPVWSVIRGSKDFRYGRNLPRSGDDIPRVSFRCFQETTDYIIFSIQTHSKENVERIITDLRLSLLRFLLFDVQHGTQVSIITFHEKAENPIHLNLTAEQKVYDDVNTNVRAFGVVQDVCLSCGLQSAINLSRTSENKNAAVVFMAFSSALRSQNLGQFIYLLESSPSRTYLIIIQDVQEDSTVPNLVAATRKTGGEVFTVPSSRAFLVTKLGMYLTSVLRNPLNIQDNIAIIHQTMFSNISGTVTDVVESDIYLEGDMTYTVICDSENRFTPNDTSTKCISLPYMRNMVAMISCGYTATLANEKDPRKWTFSFRDDGGITPLTCASIATVQLRMNTSDPLTLRGWLNTDTFERDQPGRDVLIIYAEIMHSSTPVTNAVIHAAVYSSSNSTPTLIELLDTGNGDPDMKKGDGIYSRYFTRIYHRGIHSVIIYAKGVLISDGSVKLNQGYARFSRIVPIGSFLVTKQPKSIDYYPPNRIGDLKVISIDHNNSTVTLQWTAPGDNYDDGTANRYNLKFSQFRSDLEDSAFAAENSASLKSISKDIPNLPSANLQISTVQLTLERKNTTCYIAIQTTNKNNDTSLVSNIVQVPFSQFAPVRTTEMPDVSQEPGEFISTRSESNVSELVTVTEPIVGENSFLTTITGENISSPTTNTSVTVEPTRNISVIVEPETEAPVVERNNDSCNDKYIITMASAVGGGILLLGLIINVIICICFNKRQKPKKLSRKASLRPPHNMTVIPRHSTAAMNDYSFSAPHGNFNEDFEVDCDFTFDPGSQRLKTKEQSYYATAVTMQAGNAGCTNRRLASRHNIPEDSMTDSLASTLASSTAGAQLTRKCGEDGTEAYAISLGLV